MENIYQQVVQAVENGAKFSVDFRSRSLRLNGRSVIREGNYEGSLGVEPCTEKEFLSQIEERYLRYKHSVPSERSASRSRNYFLALPERTWTTRTCFTENAGTRHRSSWNCTFSASCSTGSGGTLKPWANGSGKAPGTRTWCCFDSG